MKTSVRNVIQFIIFATAMAFTTGCAPAMMAPSTVPMGMGKNAKCLTFVGSAVASARRGFVIV